MALDQNECTYTFQKQEEEKEFDLGSDDTEAPLPLTVTSRVLYMLGDITSGPAYRFVQWLELVRKRSKHRSSGFPHRPHRKESMFLSVGKSNLDLKSSQPSEQATEISLWERLGKASMSDIESSFFSWNMLSSLHHTEHSSSTEQSEDEMNKPLEVTVNSGGVVFFALFNQFGNDESSPKEAAAVIKFSSSRMATQSERLGNEFAKWLGVQTPQVAGTWEEKSLNKWATDRIKELLVSMGSLEFSGGRAEVSEVTKCSGDAFLVTVRNKKRVGYTYELTLKVKGEWLVGGEKKKVKGHIDVFEFSLGELDDLQIVVKLGEDKDISQQEKQQICQDLKLFLQPLREKLLQFEQEIKDR